VINFGFLQISVPRYWYFLKVTWNETEFEFDCVRDTYTFSEGNRILVSTHLYVKRWVQNINDFHCKLR